MLEIQPRDLHGNCKKKKAFFVCMLFFFSAIACGAGTIYRNYFAPCNGSEGQTEANQIDALEDFHKLLRQKMNVEGRLWRMRNGYCYPSRETLEEIGTFLESADENTLDELRCALRIGVHSDVEITDGREDRKNPLFCAQAYCSALPVSYCGGPRQYWAPFATLVLEASYEATLLSALLHAKQPGGSNRVLLTQVGGGAFGNSREWIEKAVRRAVAKFKDEDLDVIMVCYGGPDRWVAELVEEINPRAVDSDVEDSSSSSGV
jgi:hypothetical protein